MKNRFYDNYFDPPHGGRPPSDAAVKAATEKYIQQEKDGKLKELPRVSPSHLRW
jgi:hypothetical protein